MKLRVALKVAKASADLTLIKMMAFSQVRHRGHTVIQAAGVVDKRCERGRYYSGARKRR